MMLLFFLLLSSGIFAQRDELKVNRRKRQRIPRLVIQEGPVWASVKPAQAAFKGSDVVDDYQWADSQGPRQVENITPYPIDSIVCFNEQSFHVRQHLLKTDTEPNVGLCVLSDDQQLCGSGDRETKERSQLIS